MSDVKLFRIGQNSVSQMTGSSATSEGSLHKVIQNNLEVIFGIRFLASEYQPDKNSGERIDTLGIDENQRPVVIEYKLTKDKGIVNQGLSYLYRLENNKEGFRRLVKEKLGEEIAKTIEWPSRLLCIARSFEKFDPDAIKLVNRNIALIRYQMYGEDILRLDIVYTLAASSLVESTLNEDKRKNGKFRKTVSDNLKQSGKAQRDRFEALKTFASTLGDDVQFETLKDYFAFRRFHNFVYVYVKQRKMDIYLKINPDTVKCIEGFMRDVRGRKFGGPLELTIKDDDDLEKAKEYIRMSYEVS